MAGTLVEKETHLAKCHLEMDQVNNTSPTPNGKKSDLRDPSQETSPTSYIQKEVLQPDHGSINSLTRSINDQSDVQPLTEVHPCRYEDCMKFHKKSDDGEKSESPRSALKHALLYLIISLLVVWVIVYTILSQTHVL